MPATESQPHSRSRRGHRNIARASAELFMWLPSFAFVAMVFTDLGLYAASRSAMSDLSREMAVKVASNRLPADLVPALTIAALPLGDAAVTVTTTTDRDVVMDFSVRIADATRFGLVGLLAGDTMTVRSTVRRDPTVTTVAWATPDR